MTGKEKEQPEIINASGANGLRKEAGHPYRKSTVF